MIISPQRRYIFVHIPKTGGTSLAAALEERAARDDILIGDTPTAKRRKARLKHLAPRGRLWKHSTLADVEGVVDPEDHFVFTLVRNPWDRMVSYYHWLRDQTFAHPAVARARSHDFRAFVAHSATIGAARATPYGSYLRDSAGRERPATFLRLEHLDADLPPLEARLGLRIAMPRINRSARRADFRSYYDAESAQLVAEMAGEDVARWGYTFEKPQ